MSVAYGPIFDFNTKSSPTDKAMQMALRKTNSDIAVLGRDGKKENAISSIGYKH